MIILFEDFVKIPKKIYNDVIKFLELPNDNRLLFPIYNRYKTYRIRSLQQFITHPPDFLIKCLNKFKLMTNIERLNIFKIILKLNKKILIKTKIEVNVKNLLIDIYKNDIKKLSNLINRDINHWLD